MFFAHHTRFVLAGAAVLAAVAFAVHSAAAPTAVGQSFSWAAIPTPTAASAPQAATTPGPIPSAAASPSADSGPLGSLRVPLAGVLNQLNAETAASARGQYSILQEIGNAIRDHIEQFLNWVVGGAHR